MPNPIPMSIVVGQDDREAAAGYMRASRIGTQSTYRRYSEGDADNSFIVQAFARHAESAQRKAIEEAAKVARAVFDANPGGSYFASGARSAAAGIEAAIRQLGPSPTPIIDNEERARLRAEIINTPETADFMAAVPLEAAHQRERWGSSHDTGKAAEDWVFLVGWLLGKASQALKAGDIEKAKHHTISSAAALANWHAAITGADNQMRPGIDPEERALTKESTT